VTLGLGLINVNAVIDTFFASRLINGSYAPTAIQKAFLVYMLPQGMFSVAIATVLFPSLARFATRARKDGEYGDFLATVGTGLRQIAFLLVPAAAVSAVLADPIVRILFQRGHFTPSQTPGVAHCLAAFSAGLVFNGAMLMLNRAFFSLKANWIPTAIALGNLFLNALLDLAFYRVGVWGIPLSTAVCNVVGTWALLVMLRRRLGRIGGAAIAVSALRIVVASAAVAAVAWLVWHPLDSALGRSFPAQVLSLGLGLSAAAVTYLLASRTLRCVSSTCCSRSAAAYAAPDAISSSTQKRSPRSASSSASCSRWISRTRAGVTPSSGLTSSSTRLVLSSYRFSPISRAFRSYGQMNDCRLDT
jgi:putative peptidoglycan lipid II flippase